MKSASRALGDLQYWLLDTTGRLSERFDCVYRVDAWWSFRRLLRNLDQQKALDSANDRSLAHFESSSFAQNGEDGIIREIFERIGITNRFFVEVGAADGEENCTRNLVESDWNGIWVEADPERATKATATLGAQGTVIAQPATRDNVAELLDGVGAPEEPDLFVMDIDGDDLGVLLAALESVRPRVIVAEYNAAFGPSSEWSMNQADLPSDGWDGTFRHGASLGALGHALSERDYQLVHCDTHGVNAFFVRSDCSISEFPAAGEIKNQFRVATFSAHPFGHPRSSAALAPMGPASADDLGRVSISDLNVDTSHAASHGVVRLNVTLRNDSAKTLRSGMPDAFHVCVGWLDDGTGEGGTNEERAAARVGQRIAVPVSVQPGDDLRVRLWVPVPTESESNRLQVTALLEMVAWLDQTRDAGAWVEATVPLRSS